MKKLIATLVLATVAAIASPAAAAPGGDSIPFVSYGGIRNWTAENDSTLFVESTGGRWYEVDLATSCFGLPNAFRVGFDTGFSNTLDVFSNVIVDGQRCPVARITALRSAPPASSSREE